MASWPEIQLFSQPKNMTTSMYSSSENFWKAYIWIMCKVTLVAIQMHQTYVLFLRMFVCVDASHHKTTCHNIKLTDMWYLDISSLALTYIYLSRTNNNFWHWSTQEELKTSQILWLIFKKKSLVAKTIGRFFPELSHQKSDFWTELIPSLAGLMQ